MLEIDEIINADCNEAMKSLPDCCIDLAVEDVPYLINYATNRRLDKDHDFCKPIANDDNERVIIDHIPELHRIMKDNSAGYMFCSPKTVSFFLAQIERYFTIKNLIVWQKDNWTAGDLDGAFGNQYEFIILFNKGRAKLQGKRYSDVWRFDRVLGKGQLHQNQKPEALIERCILSHSKRGDLVFDGFIGSGTTAAVAKANYRHYLGYEIDEAICSLARRRVSRTQLKLDAFTVNMPIASQAVMAGVA